MVGDTFPVSNKVSDINILLLVWVSLCGHIYFVSFFKMSTSLYSLLAGLVEYVYDCEAFLVIYNITKKDELTFL